MPANNCESASKNRSQSAAESNGIEKRAHPRLPFRARANAVILPTSSGVESAEWEVMTTDISRGGVSLLHRQELREGQQVLLVLNRAHRFIEVCWCCKVWPGLFAVGCRFLEEPDDATLAELLAERSQF
jgi:hypothetical protein